ncbi:translation initiation factor IF-2 [Acidaminobacter hydrogenoformans]|uniref:Translation initiation factor IF-2 n=1 Tax=Acidaminobacter hydrogenoformans DSM 2784 TaxID=1120920 RepID=A0A1G5RSQ9_9FIRM|nr:translation initiation factor IF-2 [Acidaminobacter hydrogenoformans]SCZ76848.1 bacterial translation initiation factor 2 (bIF-2) [Acidaminobacter hydrogenoformans DSM 2784]
MSKIRVYQLAKDLNLTSKELIEKFEALGVEVHNHMSTLEDSDIEVLKALLSGAVSESIEAEEDEEEIEEVEEDLFEDEAEALYEDDLEDEIIKSSFADKKIEKPKKVIRAIEEAEEEIEQQLEGRGSKNKKAKKKRRQETNPAFRPQEFSYENEIVLGETISIGELAKELKKQPKDIIMKLMNLGVMATLNQDIDFETAEMIAIEYGISVSKKLTEEEIEEKRYNFEDRPEDLTKRAPVVTVMGHVDHGKTSLLDAIRNTSVTTGEAGGITQHIGASEVSLKGEKIVFLDTPGHEAFTTLRARGAKVTDIAILVVAADDGVMPQTIEAIDHAKAAGVPIIVAVNKIDKANANPDRVKQELADRGLLIEEWGGDVISVEVSAIKNIGIDTLLEMVLLVAEMLELKANPKRPALGTILEAKVEKGRGPVATVLIENGTLRVGDPVAAGATHGRVRAMFNSHGKTIKQAGPASAVEITGLNDVPTAGDKFYATEEERHARAMAEKRQAELRVSTLRKTPHISLEDLFNQISQGQIKDLNIIVKADAHGSVEALKTSLNKITNEEVRVNVIHANVGTITESDILLASASNAIIIGFNVRPSAVVASLAENEGVELKTYRIIYEAISDVEAAMKGMLAPIYKEVVLGTLSIRATFKVPNVGTIAGAYVTNGKVTRNSQVRLIRDGIVIHEGKLSSLKRFKDDAKEVAQGYECGVGLENYNDLKEGDEIEAFIIEEVKRS